MSEEKSVEALRAELELQKKELTDRIAKLEEAAKPSKPVEWTWQKPDYTANASMSPETMREFAAAAGGGVVMRQNEREFRQELERIKQELAPTKPAAAQEPEPLPQRKSGWRDEIPLGPPPGVALADQLMDAQDARDKVELALKLAKTKMGKGND